MSAVVGPEGAWGAWGGDPLALLALLALGWAYATGLVRLWHRTGRGAAVRPWQVGAFAGGMTAAGLALVSPVEALAGTLLTAHMVQHLLLVLVAAPLLALGAPLLPVLWALPHRWRQRVHPLRLPRGLRRWTTGLAAAALASAAHVVVLWVWHVPMLYELALRNPVVHALEHVTMLGTALALWATAVTRGPVRRPAPAGVLALFATATLTVGLGALVTFAPRPLYVHYETGALAWGITALHDQQVAGALMWTVGGLVYATAGAALLGVWLARAQRRDAEARAATSSAQQV